MAELFDRGIVSAQALNFIRGRSLEKTYLIIDEAQNMTPNQVKGIITRPAKAQKSSSSATPTRLTVPSSMNGRTALLMPPAR